MHSLLLTHWAVVFHRLTTDQGVRVKSGIIPIHNIISQGQRALWGWTEGKALSCCPVLSVFSWSLSFPCKSISHVEHLFYVHSLLREFVKEWGLKKGICMETTSYLNFLSEDSSELQFHTIPPTRSIRPLSFCSAFNGRLLRSDRHITAWGWNFFPTFPCHVQMAFVALMKARYLIDSILKGEEWCQLSKRNIPPKIFKVDFKSFFCCCF